MFYFIQGPVALLRPTFAVINAGGVGYKLTISERTYQFLCANGEKEAKILNFFKTK